MANKASIVRRAVFLLTALFIALLFSISVELTVHLFMGRQGYIAHGLAILVLVALSALISYLSCHIYGLSYRHVIPRIALYSTIITLAMHFALSCLSL
nr:hypothetical protein [uncultured Porphyromonas sp.]